MNRNRSDGLINYSLLEVVIHVMGNGLAAISGYTQLLQRAISTQAQEAFSPEGDVWQQHNERWLRYLQIMRQSETLLNDFLAQLRELSREATQERLSQCVMRTDLVLLLKRSIERLAPLHQDRTMQTHLPVQSLYIMCDPFWMELVLEHVIIHTVDASTLSTPVDIRIMHDEDSGKMLHEARIEICIKRGLLRQNSGAEERFETRSRTLDTRELDVCAALCREVLRAYGGRIWSAQEAVPLVASMPGFQGTYLVKHADDRATLLLFWDAGAHAENANKLMGPSWFATNVAPYLAGPQERSVGEVIVQHQK